MTRRGGRIAALDGLRGLAALVVVVHHSLLAIEPSLSRPYESNDQHLRRFSAGWWISNTPLHIFWAGPEAVMVFFVLSGYVLAIPATTRGRAWFDLSYYPRRLVRLYVPVWCALIVAALLHLTWSRRPIGGASWWLDQHPAALNPREGLMAATIIRQGATSEYTAVLWSLKFEVWFSLLLPLVLLVLLALKSRPALSAVAAVASLVVVWAGAQHHESGIGQFALYLPVFVLGSLLAFHGHRLEIVMTGLCGSLLLAAAGLASAVMLTISYSVSNTRVSETGGPQAVGVLMGALLAVWLALNSRGFARLLESRAMQWTGSRSYSLYLVHEPIVVTCAFALGGRAEVWLFLLLVLPLSLGAAELFWRAVERPAIAGARRVGARVTAAASAGLHASGSARS